MIYVVTSKGTRRQDNDLLYDEKVKWKVLPWTSFNSLIHVYAEQK
jgi:hypothetical protein